MVPKHLAGVDLESLFHGIELTLKIPLEQGLGRPRRLGRTRHLDLDAVLGRQLDPGGLTQEFQPAFRGCLKGHGPAGGGGIEGGHLEAEPISLGKEGRHPRLQVKVFGYQKWTLGAGKTAAPVQDHGIDPVGGHGVGEGKRHLGLALAVGPQGGVEIGAGIKTFPDFAHHGLGAGLQTAPAGERFVPGQGKRRLVHQHGAQLAGIDPQGPVEQDQGLRIRGFKGSQRQHPFIHHHHRHFCFHAPTVLALHGKLQLHLGPRFRLQLLEIGTDLHLQALRLFAYREIEIAPEEVRSLAVIAAGKGGELSPGG